MLLQKANRFIFNNLHFGKVSMSGRNTTSGQIAVRHRGGSVPNSYRVVDFTKYIWDVRALLLAVEYDAIRSTLLSVLAYTNGILSFNLLASGTTVGSVVSNTNIKLGYESRVGYCANLNYLKPGIYINNLELKPLVGGKYVRTGSNYAKLVSVSKSYSIIKLRSKTLLKISNLCTASIGILTPKALLCESKKNAGYTRRIGFRPTVRGVAMNPIDHPHGGGQGKTSGGRPSVTPWAEITKGKKTRRKINYGTIILER